MDSISNIVEVDDTSGAPTFQAAIKPIPVTPPAEPLVLNPIPNRDELAQKFMPNVQADLQEMNAAIPKEYDPEVVKREAYIRADREVFKSEMGFIGIDSKASAKKEAIEPTEGPLGFTTMLGGTFAAKTALATMMTATRIAPLLTGEVASAPAIARIGMRSFGRSAVAQTVGFVGAEGAIEAYKLSTPEWRKEHPAADFVNQIGFSVLGFMAGERGTMKAFAHLDAKAFKSEVLYSGPKLLEGPKASDLEPMPSQEIRVDAIVPVSQRPVTPENITTAILVGDLGNPVIEQAAKRISTEILAKPDILISPEERQLVAQISEVINETPLVVPEISSANVFMGPKGLVFPDELKDLTNFNNTQVQGFQQIVSLKQELKDLQNLTQPVFTPEQTARRTQITQEIKNLNIQQDAYTAKPTKAKFQQTRLEKIATRRAELKAEDANLVHMARPSDELVAQHAGRKQELLQQLHDLVPDSERQRVKEVASKLAPGAEKTEYKPTLGDLTVEENAALHEIDAPHAQDKYRDIADHSGWTPEELEWDKQRAIKALEDQIKLKSIGQQNAYGPKPAPENLVIDYNAIFVNENRSLPQSTTTPVAPDQLYKDFRSAFTQLWHTYTAGQKHLDNVFSVNEKIDPSLPSGFRNATGPNGKVWNTSIVENILGKKGAKGKIWKDFIAAQVPLAKQQALAEWLGWFPGYPTGLPQRRTQGELAIEGGDWSFNEHETPLFDQVRGPQEGSGIPYADGETHTAGEMPFREDENPIEQDSGYRDQYGNLTTQGISLKRGTSERSQPFPKESVYEREWDRENDLYTGAKSPYEVRSKSLEIEENNALRSSLRYFFKQVFGDAAVKDPRYVTDTYISDPIASLRQSAIQNKVARTYAVMSALKADIDSLTGTTQYDRALQFWEMSRAYILKKAGGAVDINVELNTVVQQSNLTAAKDAAIQRQWRREHDLMRAEQRAKGYDPESEPRPMNSSTGGANPIDENGDEITIDFEGQAETLDGRGLPDEIPFGFHEVDTSLRRQKSRKDMSVPDEWRFDDGRMGWPMQSSSGVTGDSDNLRILGKAYEAISQMGLIPTTGGFTPKLSVNLDPETIDQLSRQVVEQFDSS